MTAQSIGGRIRIAVAGVLVIVALSASPALAVPGTSSSPEQRGFNIPDSGKHAQTRKQSNPSTPTTPLDSESAEPSTPPPARPIIAPAPVAPHPVAAPRPVRPALPETGLDAWQLVLLGALAVFAGACFRYAIKLDERLATVLVRRSKSTSA